MRELFSCLHFVKTDTPIGYLIIYLLYCWSKLLTNRYICSWTDLLTH